jgi:glycosyltransferase involved in cell wall biosynthesis
LNILINTTPLLEPITGVANYTYRVAECLKKIDKEQKYTYYYDGLFSDQLLSFEQINNERFFKTKKTIKKIPVLADIAKLGWSIFKKGLCKLQEDHYDIYWEPNFVLLDLPAAKKVLTVHDLSFYLYPQWHTREVTDIFKERFIRNIHRAERIITGSHFIKNEAIDILKIPQEKISVIYHGVDQHNFKLYDKDILNSISIQNNLPEKFFLCVGSIEPRKNLIRLLDAYDRLPDNLVKDVVLLLAGFCGWENEDIMARIKVMSGKVHYLGYVSNIELAYLYNMATFFIYPSLYEGFGLPPLEAMACGTPVLLSNIPVHREIYGDAAYYFDPMNVDDIAASMMKTLGDTSLRRDLANSSIIKAKQFSWERSAEEHLQVFKEVL